MATTHSTSVRTDTDHTESRRGLLLAAYAGTIIVTIAAATGLAVLLAGFTDGLGQFVLLAAGWLAVVSASPEVGTRVTARVARLELSQRTPRSNRAIKAVASSILAR